MSSPFARTYASVEEVMKLYPHLPKESILLTRTMPPIEKPDVVVVKNRKCIKRTQLNVFSGKLPSIK
jgi:hypothetical protein